MAITVTKQAGGRTWGVFVNGDLVEGGFFDKGVAKQIAQDLQSELEHEQSLLAQRAINAAFQKVAR